MKKIIPITDLQRQAEQIVSGSDVEEDPNQLDELELQKMLATAESQIATGQTIPHKKVKDRIEQQS